MKSIDTRRALGLILMGIGLLLAAIYLSGQLNRSAVPTPQPNYGPLVPTSIGKAPPTRPVLQSSATSTATSTATAEPTDTATATSTVEPTSTARAPIATATRVRATTAAITPSTVATRPATAVSTATSTTLPDPTQTSARMANSTPVPAAPQVPSSLRQRVCVGVPFAASAAKPLSELRPGWYLTWGTAAKAGGTFAQMVRVPRGQIVPKLAAIAQIAQQNPGALWLIGNEMDVIWQDNATPDQYAAAYHDVYATLKQADPTSRVAIGGVSLPSPLRLQYLDRVLQVYRERYGQDMPIDVWNVHNFILPELRGSWGVDIPPGIGASSGLQYTIDDHDNLAYFKQQLIDFRRWMAQRGYRDRELIVSEYGVLMYADYGFDYERVRNFMLGSFDVMLNTTDAALGLPADGNRLVQRWCWYSLADVDYPTGNLADVNSGELTPLGRDLKNYLDQRSP
jgi:hypothetical protein